MRRWLSPLLRGCTIRLTSDGEKCLGPSGMCDAERLWINLWGIFFVTLNNDLISSLVSLKSWAGSGNLIIRDIHSSPNSPRCIFPFITRPWRTLLLAEAILFLRYQIERMFLGALWLLFAFRLVRKLRQISASRICTFLRSTDNSLACLAELSSLSTRKHERDISPRKARR